MKIKNVLPVLIIMALMIAFVSCKKDTADTSAPTITLNGDNPVSLILGDTYTDAGATATDDVDGDLTSSIVVSGTVNNALAGTYTITYAVSDAAGNAATAHRTVYVKNAASYLNGGYSVVDVVTGKNAGTHNYNVTVSAHSSINNKLLIYNFGGWGSSVYAEMMLSGSALTISSQNPPMMTDPGTVTGSGTSDSTSVTTINYNCIYTSGGSDAGNASFTKL